MAIRRIGAAFARQDWFAVLIEFVCVVLGVLVGVQVANWNDERRHQDAIKKVVGRLLPEFREGAADAPYAARYFAHREALGRRAEELWDRPGNDEEFLASAYLTGGYAIVPDFDREGYALNIGRDTVAQIDDDELRNAVADVVGALGDEYLRFAYIDSEFRRSIRRIVPSAIQNRISDDCNKLDSLDDVDALARRKCTIRIPPAQIRSLAAAIRADRAALGQLREHLNRLGAVNGRLEGMPDLYREALKEMTADRAVAGK